jgi:hypothetical protein
MPKPFHEIDPQKYHISTVESTTTTVTSRLKIIGY